MLDVGNVDMKWVTGRWALRARCKHVHEIRKAIRLRPGDCCPNARRDFFNGGAAIIGTAPGALRPTQGATEAGL